MDDRSKDALVNRADPIPIVKLTKVARGRHGSDGDLEPMHKSSKTDRLIKTATSMKDGLLGRSPDHGPSLQDRLMDRLLQQVIPSSDPHSSAEPSQAASQSIVTKPNFNLPTMSANFRRFNARIGAVFVFQNKVIELLAWSHPSHTMSLLSVYTLVCLDSTLLPTLPLFFLILALLVPSFITRHPVAPPSLPSSTVPYSPFGPPIAPAPTVKPAKELSKDFFRNMRDLQNCMEDFTQVHDSILALLLPPTNFSDEALSSTIFVLACFGTALLFLTAHFIPWRLIFLLLGWAVILGGHPTIQKQVLAAQQSNTWAKSSPLGRLRALFEKWVAHDIILDTPAEMREVEVFELQRRGADSGEWEAWLFSPTPFDPLGSARMGRDANVRPQGTRFFEDVKPPEGWQWSGKKWILDLWSREWVEERIITGVEVETEGERWVYDMHIEVAKPDLEMESPSKKAKAKKEVKKASPLLSWEEGIEGGGRGQWRRRRWTRMVTREAQSRSSDGKARTDLAL